MGAAVNHAAMETITPRQKAQQERRERERKARERRLSPNGVSIDDLDVARADMEAAKAHFIRVSRPR